MKSGGVKLVVWAQTSRHKLLNSTNILFYYIQECSDVCNKYRDCVSCVAFQNGILSPTECEQECSAIRSKIKLVSTMIGGMWEKNVYAYTLKYDFTLKYDSKIGLV